MRLLFSNIGFFLFPFLVVVVVGFFVIPFQGEYVKEVMAFALLSVASLAFVYLFHGRARKFIWFGVTLLLSFLAFTKLSFYIHYGVKLSASALFVIFETNASEASDFLENYFTSSVILLGALFILFLLVFLRKLSRSKHLVGSSKAKIRISRKLLALLLFLGAVYGIHANFPKHNIVRAAMGSYGDYKETKRILKGSLAQPESAAIQVQNSSAEPQTHVVIIGESISSWHMELYGYPRNTNPLLTKIKDELIVFDSVISPHVHTILAMEKICTLSNNEDPDKVNNASLVQLANAAGYETYWVSNQKPVGLHESIPTIIANAAKQKFFLTTDDYRANIYDANVFPVIDTILKQPIEKKLIFVHLIGAHVDYEKRYPKNFDYFKNEPPKTISTSETKRKRVNYYDNAIRYNDYVVSSIIEKVRSQKTRSYVLYFSDHGDEVYDTMDLMGHNEFHGTRPMYEVPFLLWLSEQNPRKDSLFSQAAHLQYKKYSLEDFIHSFSDISEIKFNLEDSTRSIFNKGYVERTRFIKNGIDYDER